LPPVLRPREEAISPVPAPLAAGPEPLLEYWRLPPLGFTGPSGVLPYEDQSSSHFVPVEDRWRVGFPQWDRYGRGHPLLDDYPYAEGNLLNSYKQNVLKGDYPIIGQHTFLNVTGTNLSLVEFR